MSRDTLEQWEVGAAEWVRRHIKPELLDAWLFQANGEVRSFDEVWTDLEQARAAVMVVGPEDMQPALDDLYCAAYRWHLVCACGALGAKDSHRQAMVAAVTEVHTAQRSMVGRARRARVA
jgi:hypothetical protein